MKRIFLIAVVLAFVAGMVADVAVADERVSISGAMRVRAWYTDNLSDFNDNNDADKNSYFDQRMRVQTVINAAEGVKGVIRTDFSEDYWGSPNWTSHRYAPGTNSQFQVDRAYLDITKGIVQVKAGQHFIGLGALQVYDNNATGITLNIKPKPVSVQLAYSKESEGGSRNDEAGFEDTDIWSGSIGFKSDAFKADVFGAMQSDDTVAQDEPYVIGVNAWVNFGAAKIGGELATFGGDKGNTIDYTGTQLWLNAEAKLGDMFTLGADFVYSTGTNDATEQKITYIGKRWGDFYLVDRGPFNTDLATLGDGDVFDPFESGAGSIGAGIYAQISVGESLAFYGQLLYLTAEEDSVVDRDIWIGNVGAEYTVMKNTTLAAQYHYLAPDTTGLDEDPAQVLVLRLQISF